jgi:hypothetical protein
MAGFIGLPCEQATSKKVEDAMYTFRNLTWFVFMLFLIGGLVSCSGDDDPSGPPSQTQQLPAIPSAELTTDLDFGSSDPSAQQAETMVESQLGLATILTAMGQTYLAPLDNANWTGSGEQCWSHSFSSAGCTWVYRVCRTDQEYEWTLTFNGTCGGTQPYVNWVAMRGTTTLDGTEGTMRIYEDNSTVVGSSWAWSVMTDGLSGTWTFYDGDVHLDNRIAHLDWQENADGSQDTVWTWYGESRFEIHVDAGGNSGWMDLYNWNDGQWLLYWKIVWNADGSGYWAHYDETGTEVERQTWTP